MTKALARKVKKIKKYNAKFKAMTAAEKRVAIAQDLLKHLALPNTKLNVTQGIYLERPYGETFHNGKLKQQLEEMPSCSVCALGGLFYACALCFNGTDMFDSDIGNDSIGSYNIHSYLSEYFSVKQRSMIESAFEGYALWDGHNLQYVPEGSYDDEALRKAIDWSRNIGDQGVNTTRDRLKAIAQNIIANGGEFKPENK